MKIVKYSLKKDGEKQISKHFKVKEFRSYGDTVLIDTELVGILELFMKLFSCKSAVITSGYRTPAHDRDVGGTGSGYHVKGCAVDIKFYYDENCKKPVESWKVCCAFADMGINGVAKINDYAVHIDNGSRTICWRGDESKGYINSSVPNRDFYKYFKKTRKQVYTLQRPKVSVWSIKGNKIQVGVNSWVTFDDLRGDGE